MNDLKLHMVFFGLALICFILACFPMPSKINLQSLGLMFLTLGFLVS